LVRERGLREPPELERFVLRPESLWKMREDLLSTVRMLGDLSVVLVVDVECDRTPLDCRPGSTEAARSPVSSSESSPPIGSREGTIGSWERNRSSVVARLACPGSSCPPSSCVVARSVKRLVVPRERTRFRC